MVTAISNYPSFLGYAKETTPGTPVAATKFAPVTSLATEDVPNYTSDSAMRGSAVDSYNEVPTQSWGTVAWGGPVFMDTIGDFLLGLFGAQDVTGAGPYVHTFGLQNSGTYQPPTYTLVDYNGSVAKSYPFGVISQIELTYSADGLLTYAATATAFGSSNVTKPTQTFSAKTAVAAYKTAVTVGGSAVGVMESATVTITRQVNPIIAVNNTTNPSSIFAGSLSVSGSVTAIYDADATFVTPMRAGTATSIELATTNGADILDFKTTNGLITAAPITRGGNGYMEVTAAIKGVGNTTDANTAGGGYSPAKVILTNSTATY